MVRLRVQNSVATLIGGNAGFPRLLRAERRKQKSRHLLSLQKVLKRVRYKLKIAFNI